MGNEIILVAVQEIIGLDEINLLFTAPSKDEYEKVALTDIGAVIVNLSVKYCILCGEIPNCAVNGDDATASSDIVSLNRLELKDLIKTLEMIYSLDTQALDPSRN